jgi:integrase
METKECPYCDALPTQLCKHLKKCDVKRIFNRTKEEIFMMLQTNQNLSETIATLSKKIEDCNQTIKNQKESIFGLETKLSQINNTLLEDFLSESFDLASFLNTFGIKESTIEYYLEVWGEYFDWCKESLKYPLNTDTANEWLQSLPKTMTLLKYRASLQTILRRITKQNITLHKINNEIKGKEKLFMDTEEISKVLESLKVIDPLVFTAGSVQYALGGRVGGVANLSVNDLEFLKDGGEDEIIISDPKTGKLKKKVTSETKAFLKKYIEENKISGGYLFSKRKNERKRGHLLMKKMNKALSRAIPEKKMTTHALRRSFAQNDFQKRVEELIPLVSEQIGHKNPNITTKHYLLQPYVEKTLENIKKKCDKCQEYIKWGICEKCKNDEVFSIKTAHGIDEDAPNVKASEEHIIPYVVLTKLQEDVLILFYNFLFDNFNRMMKSWVKTHENIVLKENQINGAATFKFQQIDNIVVLNLLLLGARWGNQGRSIGSVILEFLKKKCNKIVLWSDRDSIIFYEKNGFVCDNELGLLLKNEIQIDKDADFMHCGFTLEEVRSMKENRL